MSVATTSDVWYLLHRSGPIEVNELFDAILVSAREPHADYRTRWLLQEALHLLEEQLGVEQVDRRLQPHLGTNRLADLRAERFDRVGFPSLRQRIMDGHFRERLLRCLEQLGRELRRPASVIIGGSSALLLSDLIHRTTEDIDVVDELPEAVRAEHDLLDRLATRYGVRLAHFQSHYLPDGWNARTRSFRTIGKLTIRLVDPLDILAGKLFSRREKDFDDLLVAWDRLPDSDKNRLRDRIAHTTRNLRSGALTAVATDRWAILTREETLPSG